MKKYLFLIAFLMLAVAPIAYGDSCLNNNGQNFWGGMMSGNYGWGSSVFGSIMAIAGIFMMLIFLAIPVGILILVILLIIKLYRSLGEKQSKKE